MKNANEKTAKFCLKDCNEDPFLNVMRVTARYET